MKTLLFSHMSSKLFNTFTDLHNISSTIKTLQEKQTSLVFTTDESKAEVLKWQKKLDFCAPFIAERGSVIYIPKSYDKLILSSYPISNGWHYVVLGKSHDFISAYLSTIKEKYNIQISPSSKAYEFSEIFSMDEPDLAAILNEEASLFGLTIKEKDGLFYTLGKGASVDGALQILAAFYRKYDHKTRSIMLENANDNSLDFHLNLKSALL